MSIFLGAVKSKKKEEKYYVVHFYHKRRGDTECEYVYDAKDEKDAIKKALKQHRENYSKLAIEFFSIWDNVSKIKKYVDGSKRREDTGGCF
jgi:hypothetical protein